MRAVTDYYEKDLAVGSHFREPYYKCIEENLGFPEGGDSNFSGTTGDATANQLGSWPPYSLKGDSTQVDTTSKEIDPSYRLKQQKLNLRCLCIVIA